MLIKQLREYVIIPALQITGLWSEAAENLLVMTLCAETQAIYLKQESGPALGIMQIEPATLKSIVQTLSHPLNSRLNERILSACFYTVHPGPDALIHNLRYSVLIARLIYRRNAQPLPDKDDINGLAEYYVKYYNAGGKATTERAKKIYMELGHEP